MPQKVSFAARWGENDLAEIKRRAVERDMSVSEYVLKCALGTIDVEPAVVERRFVELERRIERCEASLF